MGPTYRSNFNVYKQKIGDRILIWLDKNIRYNAENYESMLQLNSLFYNICTFNRIEKFYEYIIDVLNEEAILIVSGQYGREIISHIHSFPLIDSIYIFCQNKIIHRSWAQYYPKIRGVFSDIDFLCLYLQWPKFSSKYSNSNLEHLKSSYPLEFIECLREKNDKDIDYEYEQDKKDFFGDYIDNDSAIGSDTIDRDYLDDLNENIDTCLMYFSSNDPRENIDLNNNNPVQQSNTVIPFIKPTDQQQYLDNGTWPSLWWIMNSENNLSKMIGFNRIRHLILHTKILENLDMYIKLMKSHSTEEHFLVICDENHLEEYFPLILEQENIRRVYLHSSLDKFQKYKSLIKRFSKIISILQHSDTLIHMILHDCVHYLIKLAQHYKNENQYNFAKIRYEYALYLQSNIRTLIEQKLKLINKN